MSEQDTFNAILASLNNAVFDDLQWPAAAQLIHDFCGMTGDGLVVTEGYGDDAGLASARIFSRGKRREGVEREYFEVYYALDERVPRIDELPDSHLVHVPRLYTEDELKTSVAYNEGLRKYRSQNGLNVRLDGPNGSDITWVIADPVAGRWGSAQVKRIERLLPHIRHFVFVRHALAEAGSLGASLAALLDATGVGIIHLDHRGRIVEANDPARVILVARDGLFDLGGFLSTWLPADNVKLQKLLARALPSRGDQGAGGSMTVRLALGPPKLLLHVVPVGSLQQDFWLPRVAALVVLVAANERPRIDPDLVAEVLGLTPGESRVVAALGEGRSVRDIAAATHRQENSVYKHLKKVYRKLGVSGHVDLLRLVLRLGTFSRWRD